MIITQAIKRPRSGVPFFLNKSIYDLNKFTT